LGSKRNKGRGALAELQVATKVRALGGEVSFPHGDTAGYDLIADFGTPCRVQVKSALYTKGSCYNLLAVHGGKKEILTKAQCDVVCCVVPYGTYVIPINKIKGIKLTFFKPGTHRLRLKHPRCKFEDHYEAWHHLEL
jgi:hypothetical protein